MAKRESSPGISPAKKNEYGIEAGQILMQNKQECLTGLWPATGASSRRTARFAVSISASLTAGRQKAFRTSKRIFKKNHGFSARCPAFFFQKLNMSGLVLVQPRKTGNCPDMSENC